VDRAVGNRRLYQLHPEGLRLCANTSSSSGQALQAFRRKVEEVPKAAPEVAKKIATKVATKKTPKKGGTMSSAHNDPKWRSDAGRTGTESITVKASAKRAFEYHHGLR